MHVGNFGLMKELRSDGGSQFTAQLSKDLSAWLHFKHVIITPYHPQGNGLVERRNAEVIKHLRAIIFEHRVLESWSVMLPLVQRILNSLVDSSIGTSPAKVIFGAMMPIHDDFLVHRMENAGEMSTYVVQLNEQLEVIQAAVRQVLQKRNEAYKRRVMDKQKPGEAPSVGEYCLLSYPDRPNHKLLPVWRGPYLIMDIQRPDILTLQNLISKRMQEVHVDRVKIFYPPSNVMPDDLLRWAAADVDEFVVARILNHRGPKKKKTEMEFLVSWKDFDSSYDSWEPYVNVAKTEALEVYAKAHGLRI
jgi:hypothetical protein